MTNSRRNSHGPVWLMPGPGSGPRPAGSETLLCVTCRLHDKSLTAIHNHRIPIFMATRTGSSASEKFLRSSAMLHNFYWQAPTFRDAQSNSPQVSGEAYQWHLQRSSSPKAISLTFEGIIPRGPYTTRDPSFHNWTDRYFNKPVHHPTNTPCDTPFMTYINPHVFRHRGAILEESL